MEPQPTSEPESRRPLKSRGTAWARALARNVAGLGVSPDAVSAASMGFALAGALLLAWAMPQPAGTRAVALVGAAACMQLRLLCNLLDGMVAVEHGKGGPLGPLWNEVPDRVADACLLVGAGYAVAACGLPWGVELGWAAAVLAVFTAYVRELGRGLGFPADFSGPMAKPQRMFTLTVACLVTLAEPWWGWHGQTFMMTLGAIGAGSAATTWHRLRRLAAGLRERSSADR